MALVAPSPYNVEITCGITMPAIWFQFFGKNGLPLDYTGWTLEAQARTGVDDAEAIDFNPVWATEDPNGDAVDGAEIGMFVFPEKNPAATDVIQPGVYNFDVVTISPTSQRFGPYNQGKVLVEKNFSQLP